MSSEAQHKERQEENEQRKTEEEREKEEEVCVCVSTGKKEGDLVEGGSCVGGYVPGKAGVVCPRGLKGVCCIANWWSLVNC
jgi:hypothetical protein